MGERLIRNLFDCCCNHIFDRPRVFERVIESRGEEHDLTSGLVICLLRKAPIYSILVYILQSLPGLENAGYTLADRKATEGCARVRSGTLATNHTHQFGMHQDHQGLEPTYPSEDLSW